MIDFASIRPYGGSQNIGFEELVVQLVRRQPPPGALSFRRIEGAGGDAGAEALWLLRDGSEVGVQAKYFLRVKDIDWEQVDKSVNAILKNRPNVKLYRIAFACDLTDFGGAKGRGQSGWDRWKDRVDTWTKSAASLGRSLDFEAITKSDIVDFLARPNASGLKKFWFGRDELSFNWFEKNVGLAISDLGERYTPEHHVEISASSAVDGLARNSKFVSKLHGLLRSIEILPFKGEFSECSSAVGSDAAKLVAELERLRVIDEKVRDCFGKWNVDQWIGDIDSALEKSSSLYDSLRENEEELERDPVASKEESGKRSIGEEIRFHKRSLDRLTGSLQSLKYFLQSAAVKADTSRVLLLSGGAGTGKSHLLAAEACRAISEARPAILLLGQQFGQGNVWVQILQSLGLQSWEKDEFLGALDAIGELYQVRVLLLVDAVNEGAGAALWKNQLSSFLDTLSAYRQLGVAVTCRSEYVPFTIPKALLERYPRIELRGFSSFEEQEDAAVQYLDRRGIVRPAGPMLSPEFSNPLFLKSTSNALIGKGEIAYPRGFSGALQILSFYIECVGENLSPDGMPPVDLSAELSRALVDLALEMANQQNDFVSVPKATDIVANAFRSRPPPAGLTWLDILLRDGILRKDPDPLFVHGDSFGQPKDVIRVAYQRFQDHLVVQACLDGVSDPTALFSPGGTLAWLAAGRETYRWAGLIEALSIQLPERFGVELVDALPGDSESWWDEWLIQEAFLESIRWRAHKTEAVQSTFSERTLELVNSVSQVDAEPVFVILEVAAVPDHPWNANLLDANLREKNLPDRDVFWSRPLAFASDDSFHPIHKMIAWSTGGKLATADEEILLLVARVLGWSFSTTNREVRDSATRGLTRILVRSPSIFPNLLASFLSIDDAYIAERVLAAGYGAACSIVEDAQLAAIASATYEQVFSKGHPPQHILTRDYAVGILEMAQERGCLPKGVDWDKVYPPLKTSQTLRAPSEKSLEERKEKVGGHLVYWSCNAHGDFGSYEITPTVGRFSSINLSKPIPLTQRCRFDIFEREVVQIDRKRILLFESLREANRGLWTFAFSKDEGGLVLFEKKAAAVAEQVHVAEEAFLSLLSGDECKRYENEAQPYLFDSKRSTSDPPGFDISRARRWITNRVYTLGWNQKTFGEDRTPGRELGRERGLVERIGKKYQWISLFEFLSWLGDTHWLISQYDEPAKRFRYPTDIGFIRDIDPTIPSLSDIEPMPDVDWWKIEFDQPPDASEQLSAWVEANARWHDPSNVIFRNDEDGNGWITLQTFQRAADRQPDVGDRAYSFSMRSEAFLFVRSILVDRKNLNAAFKKLTSEQRRNDIRFDLQDIVDGPFYGELGWRDTWPDLGWKPHSALPDGVEVLQPLAEFVWESHLDASMPDGVRFHVPVPAFADGLAIRKRGCGCPYVLRNQADEDVIYDFKGSEAGGGATMINEKLFSHYLKSEQLACIWFMSGERSAWPDGTIDNGVRRWFGRLVSYDGTRKQKFEWEKPWGSR